MTTRKQIYINLLDQGNTAREILQTLESFPNAVDRAAGIQRPLNHRELAFCAGEITQEQLLNLTEVAF